MTIFRNTYIHSIATVVPNRIEINSDRQRRTTGINTRRVVDDNMDACDLAYAAATHLFETTPNSRSPFGDTAIIFITQTPRYRMPSTAFLLQEKLGLKATIAYDINLGCSGFTVGLQQATALIESGIVNNVLLLIADTLSKEAKGNPSIEPLFGDAGSAILLSKGSLDTSWVTFNSGVDGAGHQAITASHDTPLSMNGLEVYSFAKNTVQENLMDHILSVRSMDARVTENNPCDIYLHQASSLINAAIEAHTKGDAEHILFKRNSSCEYLSSLSEYGNTAGSSIPITMSKHQGGNSIRQFIACGFGVGLSWCSVYWNQLIPISILPIKVLEEVKDDK